jgi:hypothetical protein
MESSLLRLGCQAFLSNRRVNTRLLSFPVLAALVIGSWIGAVAGTNVLMNGNEIQGAVFLAFSALAAGLAGSIAVVPPERKPRTKAAFPVSGGIMLWYCCALISLPQYLIGIPPKLLSVWIRGPAFLYTFLTSYDIELPLIVFCGISCALLAFVSRDFGPDRSTEDLLGYLVWFVCAVRAFMLVRWGPVSGVSQGPG